MRLINEKELARRTGLSLSKIQKDRHLGRSFPYIKLGRTIRYVESDIEKYIRENRVMPRQRGGINA
jgi:predicted DNA-binding transcriptional regulator AlpA